jgi:hypothetical protein
MSVAWLFQQVSTIINDQATLHIKNGGVIPVLNYVIKHYAMNMYEGVKTSSAIPDNE